MRTAERRVRGTTRPDRSIVLCGSQRVGSTVLCDLLTTTGRLGHPKEYFLDDARSAFVRAWGLPADVDDATFLERAAVDGTSPNGVFAAKVMADQLGTLDRVTAGRGLHALPRPHAVLLTRRDKVAAAVSQWRAEVTGAWSSDRPPAEGPDPASADLGRIGVLHDRKHAEEARWRDRLAADGLPWFAATYEEWAPDPLVLVERVAAAVGADLRGTSPTTDLRPQRDEVNEEVAARWAADAGGCAACGV
ncbi:Stf0 family sulfotransferase [Euzebya sp.]|uniref:Stf0 family sulfotransferase n=1 Tax=Euzebya sp. TaxID=1971409 RepID=UPI0035139353